MYDYIFNNPFDNDKWVVAMLTNVSLTCAQVTLWHVDHSHSPTYKNMKSNVSHILIIYYYDTW